MAVTTKDQKCIFETEASWSDAKNPLLCLATASWRTERPVVHLEKCNRCGLCFLFCPPQCIKAVEDDHYEPDLEFCKGCGICAKECPKGAITMTPEGDYADECPSK